MPTAHIHGQKRALDKRILLQGEGVQFPCRIDFGHAHLQDIATPERPTIMFPPYLAATTISRPSLVNSAQRRESVTPFDRLICAHFECLDIVIL